MSTYYLIIVVAAALLGGGIGLALGGSMTRNVKVALAFSGAYLLALSVLHLMPEIYISLGEEAGLYVLIGFVLQIGLEQFSKGVEHGHIHLKDQSRGVFPLGIYLSLILHSFIEGLPLAGAQDAELIGAHLHDHAHAHGFHHNHNHSHGHALLYGIAIHKIPEALALTALLFHFFADKAKTVLFILIYALATPLGMGVGHFFILKNSPNAMHIYHVLLSIAVGIFLHVGTTIIFEAEEQHRFKLKKGLAVLLGIFLVWLSTTL